MRVYRGVPHRYPTVDSPDVCKHFPVGGMSMVYAFASHSTDVSVAQEFMRAAAGVEGAGVGAGSPPMLPPQTMFEVEVCEGYDVQELSFVPAEEEVIVRPLSLFRVEGVTEGGRGGAGSAGVDTVVLKQVRRGLGEVYEVCQRFVASVSASDTRHRSAGERGADSRGEGTTDRAADVLDDECEAALRQLWRMCNKGSVARPGRESDSHSEACARCERNEEVRGEVAAVSRSAGCDVLGALLSVVQQCSSAGSGQDKHRQQRAVVVAVSLIGTIGYERPSWWGQNRAAIERLGRVLGAVGWEWINEAVVCGSIAQTACLLHRSSSQEQAQQFGDSIGGLMREVFTRHIENDIACEGAILFAYSYQQMSREGWFLQVSGLVERLVRALQWHSGVGSASVCWSIAGAIAYIVAHNEEYRHAFFECKSLPVVLVTVLQRHRDSHQACTSAAHAIFALSCGHSGYREEFYKVPGLHQCLVAALQNHREHVGIVEYVCGAIACLSRMHIANSKTFAAMLGLEALMRDELATHIDYAPVCEHVASAFSVLTGSDPGWVGRGERECGSHERGWQAWEKLIKQAREHHPDDQHVRRWSDAAEAELRRRQQHA